jgi:hypothetical protein
MIGHAIVTAAAAVSMLVGSYAPAHVDVVAGDTVTWANHSVRRHTVTAEDGSWSSSDVFVGGTYAHEFDRTGRVAYFCTVHPFMRGDVDVHALLLTAPAEPGAPNRAYTLAGRSSLAAGTSIRVEGDGGGGWREVTQATVADDGSFRVSVVPSAATRYRALAGAETSPPVELLVLDRHVEASVTRRGARTTVRVRVQPASLHATVVLQLRLPERFGWWPVRQKRLDHASEATFRLRLHRRVRGRVVLTLADGASLLARSGVFHVGRRGR